MDANMLDELKRQASVFFKDKIKAARLALTDVTPSQLLTEEVTDGDSSVPDTRSMRFISRAAFEVDDYWRIVDILHKKLRKYDRRNWRASYKALVLLEHLLTHGPVRVAEEFECDQEIIKEMQNFHHVDEKGFNWGLTVQRKAERVVRMIGDASFLREERNRARKLTRGIKGFGSFCSRPVVIQGADTSFFKYDDDDEKHYMRCNSHFNDYQSPDDKPKLGNEYAYEEDHPFNDKENKDIAVSLLSA